MSHGTPPLRLALGADRAIAVLPDGEIRALGTGAGSLATKNEDTGGVVEPDVLEGDLDAFLTGLEPDGVAWTLLPSLVDVRSVEVPPLRPEETTAALERHAARYFPSARGPQVVAWRVVERPRGEPVRLLAAAMSEDRLARLSGLLEKAGLERAGPVPATEAWVAAARTVVPELADGAVAVADGSRVVLIGVRSGRAVDAVVLLGRAQDRVVERVGEVAEGGIVVVLGDGAARSELEDALEAAREGSAPLDVRRSPREDGAVVAARYAPAGGLTLVPAAERAARRRRERRLAGGLWAAAAVLVVMAGLVELWGVHRELAAVRAERAEIAASVSVAMAKREEVEALRSAVVVLDSLARTGPTWAGLVAELADHLPRGAYLAALRGEPDSVTIEGVATDAAGVFAALRLVPGVRDVRAGSPIRREQQGGFGEPVERFTLGARLDAPNPDPAAEPGPDSEAER